jgi:hypothetical protein
MDSRDGWFDPPSLSRAAEAAATTTRSLADCARLFNAESEGGSIGQPRIKIVSAF